MEKEYYKNENNEFSINITNSTIDSIRRKQIIRKSVRIFDNTYIGIAGSKSDIDFNILEKQAQESLELGNLINYTLPDGNRKEWNIIEKDFSNEYIINTAEDFLSTLNKEIPDFIFSGKMNYDTNTMILKNTRNANYSIKKNLIDISLLFKHKESANIIDGFFGNMYKRDMDINEFVDKLKQFLAVYDNKIKIEEKKLPVVFLNYTMSMPFRFIIKHINGERLGYKTSFFNDKESKKIFNEKFSLYDINYMPEHNICSPIDGDGYEREIESIPIFEDGIFKTGLYDIKRARQFCKVPTGTSIRSYNGGTIINPNFLYLKESNMTIEDIDKCIIIMVESGGDFQDNGNISIPVQLAFLSEYGKIKGRINQITLTNDIDNIFNNDYIGALENGLFSDSINKYTVFNMNIN